MTNLIQSLRRNYQLDLTEEQLLHYAGDDPEALEIIRIDSDDTADREVIAGCLVCALIGDHWYWPVNGDSEGYKDDFANEFFPAAMKAGIKLWDKEAGQPYA